MARTKIHPKIRRTGANVLALIALIGTGIIAVLLIGVVLMMIFLSSSGGKNTADELAIGVAKTLNSEDKQGRTNILVERSRELVFSSRKNYNEISRNYRYLEPLARQNMEESRLGARLVNEESRAVANALQSDCSTQLREYEKRLSERSTRNLSWFRTATPKIIDCSLGTLKDADSNALAPQGFEELKAFDLSSEFVNRESHLYKSEVDAKLPSPDDDLHFRFSALPAPVKGTIPGARLMSDEKYQEQSKIDVQSKNISFDGKIPCAVRLKLSTQLTASGRGELSGNVASSSVALTNGGSPAPDEEP